MNMKQSVLFFSFLFFSTFLNAQAWEQVAPLPLGVDDARHHPVTFSINGLGYFGTGSVNGNVTKDFKRYDPVTDTWDSIPDFPGEARSFAYGTARGTKAYMGFGRTPTARLNDLWEYDAETEQWTRLADCPCVGRTHPAFIQLEDKIFVGLGSDGQNLKDWWEYDIPTDTWMQHDDLPGFARHHPFYFGIDDVAYVGLGHGSEGAPTIYKDFYKFDPETATWTQLTDFPGEGRVAGTQFDYNGKGYVLSGDGEDHSHMEEGEFWEYDPALDQWTQLPSHPGSSRWAPGNFVIDNYVYFMCGLSSVQMESDMMRFELEPALSNTNALQESSLAVFPNPATSSISFSEDISQYSDVLLVDALGRPIKRLNSNQVNLEGLSSGLYFLQFYKDGALFSKKIRIVD
jgi:N-acetylneuraminic acid mutarotase